MSGANPQTIGLAEARAQYNANRDARIKAREDQNSYLQQKAQSEHDYRKALSVSMAKHRADGKGVSESEIHAKADAAHLALNRDLADANAKAAAARLEQLEGDRATIRQIADWSQRVDGGAG